jgi:hypothetical protein
MPYNTNMDTITVNDVEYDVQREQDRGGSAAETLTITLFNVDTDEDEAVFDGLEARSVMRRAARLLSARLVQRWRWLLSTVATISATRTSRRSTSRLIASLQW